MPEIPYHRHRFPPAIIGPVYLRFTLSYRDVEVLLAKRGLGPVIARWLRQCPLRLSDHWHLDEMVLRIGGEADVSVACRRPRG
jgi:transposase-like protein